MLEAAENDEYGAMAYDLESFQYAEGAAENRGAL
jgi:hypothetical protein